MENAYDKPLSDYQALPSTLKEAKELAGSSKFVVRVLGEKAVADYLGVR